MTAKDRKGITGIIIFGHTDAEGRHHVDYVGATGGEGAGDEDGEDSARGGVNSRAYQNGWERMFGDRRGGGGERLPN